MFELSTDHKPTIESEKKRIIKTGGRVENGRINGKIAMSRALGDFEFKQVDAPKDAPFDWYLENQMVTAIPEIKVIPKSDDIEFLILACDGIWDCRSSL